MNFTAPKWTVLKKKLKKKLSTPIWQFRTNENKWSEGFPGNLNYYDIMTVAIDRILCPNPSSDLWSVNSWMVREVSPQQHRTQVIILIVISGEKHLSWSCRPHKSERPCRWWDFFFFLPKMPPSFIWPLVIRDYFIFMLFFGCEKRPDGKNALDLQHSVLSPLSLWVILWN